MISSIFCTSSPVVASTMGSSSSTPREYCEPPSLNSIGMAFLLYPPGSRELDLLQTAVLNVGQHSTRFGGERPSKSARSGLSGLRLSARRFAPCQHASGL